MWVSVVTGLQTTQLSGLCLPTFFGQNSDAFEIMTLIATNINIEFCNCYLDCYLKNIESPFNI